MVVSERTRRWIDRAVVVLLVSIPVLVVVLLPESLHDYAGLIGAAVSIGLIIVVSIWERISFWMRRRRLRARIDDDSVEVPGEKENSDLLRLSTEELRLKEYRAKRDEAEAEISRYLPANPRGAKRLINHERFYGQIAEDRHIFGGEPELTHRHLAKWVLILEHWPRLGAALTRQPDNIIELENCIDLKSLQERLNSLGVNIRATSDLLEVLHQTIPLSPILDRLVRFEPSIAYSWET